jgi:hypothetical protein
VTLTVWTEFTGAVRIVGFARLVFDMAAILPLVPAQLAQTRPVKTVVAVSGGIEEPTTFTEAATANRHPLDTTFGDNGGFYVFHCANCPDMPLARWFDCS